MSLALQGATERTRRRLDLSSLLFAGFALFLVVLIVLPMAWLVVFAFTDAKGAITLANFVTMVTDPDLVDHPPLGRGCRLRAAGVRRAHRADRQALSQQEPDQEPAVDRPWRVRRLAGPDLARRPATLLVGRGGSWLVPMRG